MQNTPVNFILHWYEYKNTSNWPRFDIPYDDGLYNSKLISLLIICVFIFIVWFICLLFQLLYFFLFCIVSLTRKRRKRALDWFYLIWLIFKLTKMRNTFTNFILHWNKYKNTSNWHEFDDPCNDGLCY